MKVYHMKPSRLDRVEETIFAFLCQIQLASSAIWQAYTLYKLNYVVGQATVRAEPA